MLYMTIVSGRKDAGKYTIGTIQNVMDDGTERACSLL